jgi:hypothetical protein
MGEGELDMSIKSSVELGRTSRAFVASADWAATKYYKDKTPIEVEFAIGPEGAIVVRDADSKRPLTQVAAIEIEQIVGDVARMKVTFNAIWGGTFDVAEEQDNT